MPQGILTGIKKMPEKSKVEKMDYNRAIESVKWAEQHLGFRPSLTPVQFQDWARVAMRYSSEQWAEGVRLYYQERKKDFPPPLGLLTDYMPQSEPAEEKIIIYTDGFEPPFEETQENYQKNADAYYDFMRKNWEKKNPDDAESNKRLVASFI